MNKHFERMQKLAFGAISLTESNEKMTRSALKQRIREMALSEMANPDIDEAKKKKKDEAPQAPEEEVATSDVIDTVDTLTPDHSNEMDLDPQVKAVQDSLQRAYANARALGDEKLMTQIGNSITYFTRTQVLGANQASATQSTVAVAEIENPYEREVPDIIKTLRTQNPEEQREGITSYLKMLEELMHSNTDELWDFENLSSALAIFNDRLANKIKQLKHLKDI